MTSPRLNLLVIRSENPEQTVKFYELLGLEFQKELHGTNPVHWAAELERLVIEIYPSHPLNHVDRSTRLGFEIEDVRSVLATLRDENIQVVSDLKPTQWGLRVVVRDPDGRSVELVQTAVA